MLSLELTVRRGAFAARAELEAPAGEVTVLFGPSGSGKSTLLLGIAGLLPAAGRCAVGDVAWQDDGAAVRLPAHRRRVGFVFQDGGLLPHLDVAGELAYVARRRGTQARVAEVADACELAPLLARPTPLLSGGERQRVALARALLADPVLLLLDEPLSSLDRPTRRRILPLIEGAARRAQVPVLYVTHSLTELCRLGDRVVPIENGRAGAPLTVDAALAAQALPVDDRGPSALLRGRMARGGDDDGLACVAVDDQQLFLEATEPPLDGEVRIRVRARDVSLTLDPPRRTSILNVLPGRVLSLQGDGPAAAVVTVDVGDQVILARVSRRSVRALGLEPGLTVYAQIKAVALT